MIKISKTKFLDPTVTPSRLKFSNHSCSPNSLVINSIYGVFLVAQFDLDPHTEVTWDFQLGPTSSSIKTNIVNKSTKTHITRCLCGSSNCRGKL